ncbi:DNA-directed RNA polymerase [Fusarium oxysporum]|nr:DNA-directed RNA polymerase [Fusarium oxysporum]
MDQAYRLLKAACVYCKGFRLPQKELHKYVCQLKLLQHGLIQEAHVVGAIGDNELAIELGDFSELESEAEEEGGTNSIDNVTRARDKYVDKCLSGIKIKRGDTKRGKHEGSSEMRREIIKEFLAEITKRRVCASCGGISPSYRKDRFVKVFERSLSDKDKAKMAQKNFKQADAMARVHQAATKQKPDGYSSDEGVADVASPTRETSRVNGDVTDQDTEMIDADTASTSSSPQRYISAMEVRARLNELFTKEQELVSLLYNAKPPTRSSTNVTPDMFFLTTILVPPNRYRPEARTGEGCGTIARLHRELQEEKADVNRMHQASAELQESVNALIDKNKNPVQGAAAKRNEDGIKQKLEKKEGLFRKNMMGKRVNYAARSVISPDPNIETNEIGVPPVFAKKLTYPEPVTSHNFRDMQQAVINGVDKWPGAFAIENENGQIVNLRNKSVDDRVSLANQLLAPTSSNAARTRNKKVYRHLTNGDVVLMNRQPTLHKPSIMGHRVRVLPGEKTIRMHYANCNTYNADFDGDEMNMHFPQNEVARAEALQIADTDHQYLSGTAGKPLRGLIQDHISVSVALCNRDTFFTKGDYQQLVYNALRPESGHIVGERIELVAPAVIRPVARWTGKQVITTILKNMQPPNCGGLSMKAETQIKASQWGVNSEEGTVVFQDGEFIAGILDKSQIGPSSGGVIHAVHEIYGPAVAGKLLSSLGRLLTRYLNMRAFSCGMDDLRLTPEGEQARREALVPADSVGLKVASSYVSLEQDPGPRDPLLLERLEEVLRDDSKQEGLDLLMKEGLSKITDKIQTATMPVGLEKAFPFNQMQAMTTSGAKGSRVNASLISCNLGQQVLEGRRVPIMVSGKSLPCFNPFETHARAGGYIVQRFLTGIRPQEYYFHHMAGREGLIDTAVKTSRSGYLQRCVIKGMEGLTVAYDTTVRDADGSMIQFLYGEDGLDVSKQKYLTDFSFILENVTSEASQLRYDPSVGDRLGMHRDAITKYMKKALKHTNIKDPKAQDPISGLFNPATTAFATSENFYKAMTSYIKENKDGLVRDKSDKNKLALSRVSLNKKNAEMLFAMKYLRSLVEPGEAVGIVAGQSVGEPSTQMTLNTFHLAGHSAKNVTLGIPRLREILMTASDKISTPAMSIYPIEEMSVEDAEIFAKSISVLPLGFILDSINVEEKIYKYTKTYAINISDVVEAVERKLLHRLLALVKKDIRKRMTMSTMATPDVGAKAAAGNFDDDEDDEDAKRSEAVSYGPNDDDDDAVQQEMERDAGDDDADEDEDFGGSPQQAEGDGDGDDVDWSAKARTNRVLEQYAEVIDFSFTLEYDSTIPKVLMLNLVQDAVRKTVIQEISGVGACTLVEEKDTKVIHTAGVNLQAMQRYSDFIDPNRIQTNDIAAVLAVYELAGVFGSHGIKVDNRHLNLIGDHMTRNGGFTPFNRMGLKGNTTLAFLKDAVLDGDWDDLSTPSGRLVMGRLGKVGTGGFDVLAQLPTYHVDSLA